MLKQEFVIGSENKLTASAVLKALSFSLLCCLCTVQAGAQLKTSLLKRVVEITVDQKSVGTAFFVDEGGKGYLATAKHVLVGVEPSKSTTVYVRTSSGWEQVHVRVEFSTIFDLAVLRLPDEFASGEMKGIPLCTRALNIDEDYIFLGFPFDLHNEAPNIEDVKMSALPYVKRAMGSGSISLDSAHGLRVLDGINNPGFSGGPLLAKDTNELSFCVAGVVTSYKYNAGVVYDEKQIQTGETFRENTGLMFAVPQGGIVEAIALFNSPSVGSPTPNK